MSKNDDVLAELMRPTSRRRKNWTDKLSDEHREILFKMRRLVQAGEPSDSVPNLHRKFTALANIVIAQSTFFGFMSDDGTRYPEPQEVAHEQETKSTHGQRRRRTRRATA